MTTVCVLMRVCVGGGGGGSELSLLWSDYSNHIQALRDRVSRRNHVNHAILGCRNKGNDCLALI